MYHSRPFKSGVIARCQVRFAGAFEAELRDALYGPRIIAVLQEGGLGVVVTLNWHESVAFGRVPIYIERNLCFPAT